MRIRTMAALVTGAALGASGVDLLDPEVGPERRREALQQAWDRSREIDWALVLARAGEIAQELGTRAAEGYREGLGTDGDPHL